MPSCRTGWDVPQRGPDGSPIPPAEGGNPEWYTWVPGKQRFICLLCNKCATSEHVLSKKHTDKLLWYPETWLIYWRSRGVLGQPPPQPHQVPWQQQPPPPPPPPASAAASAATPASTARAATSRPEQAHSDADFAVEVFRINACHDNAHWSQVLGLSTDQSEQATKKKYRELALKLHPDKQLAGDEQYVRAFLKVQAAYESASSKPHVARPAPPPAAAGAYVPPAPGTPKAAHGPAARQPPPPWPPGAAAAGAYVPPAPGTPQRPPPPPWPPSSQ